MFGAGWEGGVRKYSVDAAGVSAWPKSPAALSLQRSALYRLQAMGWSCLPAWEDVGYEGQQGFVSCTATHVIGVIGI